MAVSGKMYTNGVVGFVKGDFSWKAAGSTFKVALMQTGFSGILNQDTNVFWSDVSAQEIAAGNGYTAGGVTLTTLDPIVDAPTNEIRLDANDATWSTATISAYYAVIYQSTGTASTSRLLGYVDFGGVQSSSASDFTLRWNSEGIFGIAAA